MAPTRERRSAHDPGVVLRDLAVAIADGGDHVSDLGVLRGQEALFGAVASESTAHRVIKSIDADLAGSDPRRPGEGAGSAPGTPAPGREEIDPRHRRLPAHRPLREGRAPPATTRAASASTRCSATWPRPASRWPAVLRPGNAGANTAADHFEVLQLALEQLPEAETSDREILARADIGGRTHAFTAGLPRRRHPLLGRLRGRRAGARGDRGPARIGLAARRSTATATEREGAQVTELTDASTSPPGPRARG